MRINLDAERSTPVERLRELFIYNPESGLLLHRAAKGYGPSRVYALQPAGTVGKSGYLTVYVDGRLTRAHRVCWAIHFGAWPTLALDHLNGQKLDNRIANMREATQSENMQNSKIRSDNQSGVTGVDWRKDRNMWRARIKAYGKTVDLGQYERLEDAAMVRRIAEHTYWEGLHAFPQAA